MSLSQTAFLHRSRVPDSNGLEQAAKRLGFDLLLDRSFKAFVSSGFLPCTLQGKNSGFEIEFESPNEALDNFPNLRETIGTRDTAISFHWSGDFFACASVQVVCAALAKEFGAIVH